MDQSVDPEDDDLPDLCSFLLGMLDEQGPDADMDQASDGETFSLQEQAVSDAAASAALSSSGASSFLLDSLAIDLPVELHVRTDEIGGLRLVAGPPTQRTETSILPVWHRLRFRVTEEHGD